LVLRCFQWNKSDLKDGRRDGESNKAFPLTPPSPPGRGRTCERFVKVRGMSASIPRIEARRQGRLSFQPLAPVSIPPKIARNPFVYHMMNRGSGREFLSTRRIATLDSGVAQTRSLLAKACSRTHAVFLPYSLFPPAIGEGRAPRIRSGKWIVGACSRRPAREEFIA
jgi:hypothetical protein